MSPLLPALCTPEERFSFPNELSLTFRHHQSGKIAARPLLVLLTPNLRYPGRVGGQQEPEAGRESGQHIPDLPLRILVPTFGILPWALGGTSHARDMGAPWPLALGGECRGVFPPLASFLRWLPAFLKATAPARQPCLQASPFPVPIPAFLTGWAQEGKGFP